MTMTLGLFVVIVAADFGISFGIMKLVEWLTPDASRIRRRKRNRADISEALARPDPTE